MGSRKRRKGGETRTARRIGAQRGHNARQGAMYGALRRHAIPDSVNQPLRCHPGLAELRGEVSAPSRGNDGKVCFPNRTAAERAACEMVGDADYRGGRARAYQCTRLGGTAPDGHFHLTTTEARPGRRADF